MRKLMLTATLLSVAAIGAAAHSLAVPFFADNAPNLQGGTVSQGVAGFIGLMNTSSAPVLVDVTYVFDSGGTTVSQTPQRFQLQPLQGVSWRPYKDDPTEGNGRLVPNILPGGQPFGAAKITWRGGEFGANTLTGRYVQISTTGSFAHILKD